MPVHLVGPARTRHSLERGCVAAWRPTSAHGLLRTHEVEGRSWPVARAGASVALTSEGTHAGQWTALTVPLPADAITALPVTLAWRGYWLGPPVNGAPLVGIRGLWHPAYSSFLLQLSAWMGAGPRLDSGLVPVVGRWATYAVTIGGTSWEAWQDGRRVKGGNWSYSLPPGPFALRLQADSGLDPLMRLSHAWVWRRALSTAEHTQLHTRPDALWQGARRRVLFAGTAPPPETVATPTGLAVTVGVGAPVVQVAQSRTVAPAGLGVSAALGLPVAAVVQDATSTPAGVGAQAALGTVTVQLTQSRTATPAGVEVTTALGAPVVTIAASGTALPAGVAVTAHLGIPVVAVTQSSTATPAGVAVTATLGLPSLVVVQSRTVAVAGLGATVWLGTVTVGTGSVDLPQVVLGPVATLLGVSGATATLPGVAGAVSISAAISGPIQAYSQDANMALDESLSPNNEYLIKAGPLLRYRAGVEIPAPATGLTLTCFIAETDDILDAVAIDGLTSPVPETEPGVSGQYDAVFLGADLATAPTLVASMSGTTFFVHLRSSDGSYAVYWPATWERSRRAESA